MCRGIEERLVLVLPVQLDEPPGQILERAGGRERAVDERAAASLRRDLATNQQLFAAAFEDALRSDAASSPVRTRSPEARPPSSRPTASTRIDLPAPVSPVRTLRPASNSTSTASMTARCLMRRKRSIGERQDENSNRNIGLTAISRHDTVSAFALSQRRTADVSEDRLRTLGSLTLALLAAGDRAAPCLKARARPSLKLVAEFTIRFEARPPDPRPAVDHFLERSSSTSCGRSGDPSASRQSFLDVFRRSNKFSEVQAVCRSLGDSPLVGLFQSGYAELTAQLRQTPAPNRRSRQPIRAPRPRVLR